MGKLTAYRSFRWPGALGLLALFGVLAAGRSLWVTEVMRGEVERELIPIRVPKSTRSSKSNSSAATSTPRPVGPVEDLR